MRKSDMIFGTILCVFGLFVYFLTDADISNHDLACLIIVAIGFLLYKIAGYSEKD